MNTVTSRSDTPLSPTPALTPSADNVTDAIKRLHLKPPARLLPAIRDRFLAQEMRGGDALTFSFELGRGLLFPKPSLSPALAGLRGPCPEPRPARPPRAPAGARKAQPARGAGVGLRPRSRVRPPRRGGGKRLPPTHRAPEPGAWRRRGGREQSCHPVPARAPSRLERSLRRADQSGARLRAFSASAVTSHF